MIGNLPDGLSPSDVTITKYEDMTKNELIEACNAHDQHHEEHHEWILKILNALYPDGVKHPQQSEIDGIVEEISFLKAKAEMRRINPIKKVWVCYRHAGYEGCSEPLAVFCTQESAKTWQSGYLSAQGWGEPRIVELEATK